MFVVVAVDRTTGAVLERRESSTRALADSDELYLRRRARTDPRINVEFLAGPREALEKSWPSYFRVPA